MSTTVSYVWVNNSAKENEPNEILCTEEGHGLRNIIANANKTPNAKHVLYVDRLTNGETTYDANIKLPSNVEFKTVDSLFEECEVLMKEGKEKFSENHKKYISRLGEFYQPLIDDIDDNKYKELILNMKEIYNAEMQYGKPAFAGNVVKFLSIYKGEIACDIGLSLKSEKIINDVNNDLLQNKVTGIHIKDGLASTLQFMHVPKRSGALIRTMNDFYVKYRSKRTTPKYQNYIDSDVVSVEEFVKYATSEQKKSIILLQDWRYAGRVSNMFKDAIKEAEYLRYCPEEITWSHKLSWKENAQNQPSDSNSSPNQKPKMSQKNINHLSSNVLQGDKKKTIFTKKKGESFIINKNKKSTINRFIDLFVFSALKKDQQNKKIPLLVEKTGELNTKSMSILTAGVLQLNQPSNNQSSIAKVKNIPVVKAEKIEILTRF